MNSINSKYGGLVGFPTVLFTEIYQEMGLEFKSDSNKWFVHFDEVKPLGDDLYEAKMKKATFLIDDADENIIRYFWRSKKDQRSIARFISRNDHISSLGASSLDNERIKTNPFLNRYLNSPIFYISDNDDSLSLPSFKETFKTNEITGEKTVSYIQDGLVVTPTEGWSVIMNNGETVGTIPVFEGKDSDWIMQFCSEKKLTGNNLSKGALWIQDIEHTIRNQVGDDVIAQINLNHLPTSIEQYALRKSLTLCNKIKAVIKCNGDIFELNSKEIAYILILKPTERNMGIGNIFLADLTRIKNKDECIAIGNDLINPLITFLNGKLLTRPLNTIVMKAHELKEPFLLDPSEYVN